MNLPVVAILGRPNVGKSSLFNRILQKKVAIVEETPGVTRDRNYGEVEWGGRTFIIVDTGGFLPKSEEEINESVKDQIDLAIEEASLVLFVVDGREGPQALDFDLIERVRKKGKPALLAVNKVDSFKDESNLSEFFTFGLGKPHAISALQGRMVGDLLDELISLLPNSDLGIHPETGDPEINSGLGSGSKFSSPYFSLPKIAIIGRPNVGKSSIVNKILGEKRLIVDPVPGTTRDSIDTVYQFEDKEILLVDTAGLKKKSKTKKHLEVLSTLRSIRSLARCDVAMVVLDGTEELSRQDKRILALVSEKGKGAVVALNKVDLMEEEVREELLSYFWRDLKLFSSPPVHLTSAVTGEGIHATLQSAIDVFGEVGKRVKESELSDVLREAVRKRPPPLSGKGLWISKWKQQGTHPPQFLLYSNQPELIPPAYLQFLKRKLRERFGFQGVPIQIKPVRTKYSGSSRSKRVGPKWADSNRAGRKR
jgi:GTP-binding protein